MPRGRDEITEDGKQLWGVAQDRNGGVFLQVRDLTTSEVLHEGKKDFGKGNLEVHLVPGGKYYRTQYMGLYDRKAFRPIGTSGPGESAAAFSPDGEWYAAAGRGDTLSWADAHLQFEEPRCIVRIVETATGRPRLALRGSAATAESVALSADRRRLAVANDDGTLEIWPLPAAGTP